MQSCVHQYIGKYLTIANNAMIISHAMIDEEVIHEMRVSVKRLRSVGRLLKFIDKKLFNLKKELRKVRPLYSASGDVRDLQVQTRLVKSYSKKLKTSFPSILLYLEANKDTAIHQFRTELVYSDLRGELELGLRIPESDDLISDKKLRKHARLFIIHTLKIIDEAKQDLKDVEHVHTIRKRIKDIQYVLGLLESCSLIDDDWDLIQLSDIKKLSELLGGWHDKVQLKQKLKEFLKATKANKKIKTKAYQKFIKTLNKDTKSDIKAIQKALESHITEEKWLHAA